jgi:hypothetical protein
LFLARAEKNGRITVAPTSFAGQVLEMHEFPGGGVLIRSGGGLILARAADGKVTLAEVGGSGSVRGLRRFAGGVLVEDNTWWLLREVRGKVTGAPFGDDVAGTVDAVGQFVAGGLTLLHGEKGWFTARPDGDKVTFAPAAVPTPIAFSACARERAAGADEMDGFSQAKSAARSACAHRRSQAGEVFATLSFPAARC